MAQRVLHVLTSLKIGGAETMILNLYRAMNREEVQFDFLLHTEEIGHFEEEVLSLGGRIYRLSQPELTSIKSYQKKLYQFLSQHSFSAVHSHTHYFSGFILEVAKKVSIPIRIAHSHTTSDGKETTLYRSIYRSYMKWKLRKYATHIFGCSKDAVEALLAKGVTAEVLPNAFNIQSYKYVSNRGTPCDLDSLVIGHVGRFDPVKNHIFFLNTFSVYKKIHPRAKAILVGDGPERQNIEELIRTLKLEDSVTLLGIRSDIPEILGQMDLFLFPSIYEGLGNVVVEAQAAGLPCLVSDTLPKEVDLSMNLVTFLKLEDGEKMWVDAIDSIDFANKPSWDVREHHLKKFGYDSRETAKFLEKVYIGK